MHVAIKAVYCYYMLAISWNVCGIVYQSTEWITKRQAMVLRTNVFQYNRCVFIQRLPILWEKTEYICLALVCLMAGWQAGWQTKYGWVSFFKNSVQIKLFRFLLHLISVQCYYSVTKAFQSAFLKSSFKVCFEVCIFSCHFLRQLLLSARVLNDYTQMGMILVTTCVMKIIFGNDEWHSLHSKTSLKICIHLDGSIFTLYNFVFYSN